MFTMHIVVGLGNPGAKYTKTRHNVGFRVVDEFSTAHKISLEEKDSFIIGRGTVGGHTVVLLKPLTYMNRSGTAVRKVLRRLNIRPEAPGESLIVIHDDLDIGTGTVKIRKSGSSGGHKGIESIIQETGTKEFTRIKVGIGRDSGIPVDAYVLGTFRAAEKNLIKDAIIKAADAAFTVITEGVDKAMNKYNRSSRADGTPA